MVVIVTCRNVHLVGMREENERESVVVVIVMYSEVSVKIRYCIGILYITKSQVLDDEVMQF